MILIISSCSKKILIGTYNSYTHKPNTTFFNELKLNKDSTFTYTEGSSSFIPPDLASITNDIGKGRYQVKMGELILNFEPKFRKVNKVEIIPVSLSDLSKIIKRQGNPGATNSNKISTVFNVYKDVTVSKSSKYEHPYFNMLNVSDKKGSVHVIGNQNNYLEFDKSQFPLQLVLDFGRLVWDGGSLDGYKDLPLGFLDKKINIETPGNLKINIYLFKELERYPNVLLIGQKVFPIKILRDTIRIGDMIKVENKKQ
ncbi:MAG: hypothetical protein JWQ57_1158 [Mucilaginibacter sp.]|nr:hypothetical protein [Mucilaginibacter sp.]